MVFLSHLLMFLLLFTAFVLIVLVLIQRGKGGGLAGAFGGMGGQSAFGTKAGDLFTKITIGVAIVWIPFASLPSRCWAGVAAASSARTSAAPRTPISRASRPRAKQQATGEPQGRRASAAR